MLYYFKKKLTCRLFFCIWLKNREGRIISNKINICIGFNKDMKIKINQISFIFMASSISNEFLENIISRNTKNQTNTHCSICRNSLLLKKEVTWFLTQSLKLEKDSI